MQLGALVASGVAAGQRRLFALMMGCYALALVAPGPGLALRHTSVPLVGAHGSVSLLLLAAMLFAAGTNCRIGELGQLARRPGRPMLGITANALMPLLLLPALAAATGLWHDPREADSVVVGLALVLSMPIAGGAASWGQAAGADTALAVAMVLGSTVLSPLTIPLGLGLAGLLTLPHSTAQLQLAGGVAGGAFAVGSVVLPCLAGVGLRLLAGERRMPRLLPFIKAVNLLDILLLCYSNASAALGHLLRRPDPDAIAMAVTAAALVCAAGFLLGAVLARLLRARTPQAVALTLASGINNSSAASVLAGTCFPGRPGVLLPVLSYSLLQKAIAARAARGRRAARDS
ncbi:hypothetical protein GCM10009665_07110 [Kitasatospora nipponensis]|uniref:BASS family bile acid:Na+ symporter n=1 Tax=Kitasatospora nipponensis TaxID=258049 RepID=A0ABN1VTQ3_9ACTN